MFGRNKNDDGGIPGLSGLGSASSGTARPSGIPGSSSAEGPAAAGRPAQPQPQFGGGNPGPQIGQSTPWEIGPWTIRLFVLLFIAAFAIVFSREEERRLNDPVEQANRGEITTTSSQSLIRRANLSRALAAVQRQSPAGATVESLRITPTRIDVTVAQSDGAQFEFAVDPSFHVDKDDYPASEPDGLPFSRIPTGVPERLLKTIDAKLGLKPANLDYVLLSPRKDIIDGTRDDSWGAYYSKPPLHNDATATLAGTDVRLLGTPDAKTRARLRTAARQTLASLERSEQQIKSAPFGNSAARKQALENIRRAKAQAKKNLEDAGS